MGHKRGGMGRGEITERVSASKRELDEKGRELEVVADDHDIVGSTFASLDFGGTSEGTSAVRESMIRADEVTDATFNEKDRELEHINEKTDDFNDELKEGANRDAADVDKIERADSSVRTSETSGELERARGRVREDMEFLRQKSTNVDEMASESNRAREALRNRVRTPHHGNQ